MAFVVFSKTPTVWLVFSYYLVFSCGYQRTNSPNDGHRSLGGNNPNSYIPAGYKLDKYFKYTASPQYYTVPAGVGSIYAELCGGSGGCYTSIFGLGGCIYGLIPVKPRDVLTIHVGGRGSNQTFPGYNGGGKTIVVIILPSSFQDALS